CKSTHPSPAEIASSEYVVNEVLPTLLQRSDMDRRDFLKSSASTLAALAVRAKACRKGNVKLAKRCWSIPSASSVRKRPRPWLDRQPHYQLASQLPCLLYRSGSWLGVRRSF